MISKIQYITNGASEKEILDEVVAVLDAGIDWVQLRIKDESIDFLRIAKKVKSLCTNKATFIINDKIDITKEVDADGVHLGLEDTPVDEARRLLGSNKIIGGTANTIEQAQMHKDASADYVGMGPYRFTKTKKKLSPILGIEGYATPVASKFLANFPVVAIGGILTEDIRILKDKTSVHGVALSGLIKNSENQKELVQEIKEILR